MANYFNTAKILEILAKVGPASLRRHMRTTILPELAAAAVLEANQVVGATIAVVAEVSNEVDVTIQLTDAQGDDLAVRGSVLAYLSDDANGDSIAATAPDGGWAIDVDGLLFDIVANKAAHFVSESDGDIALTITEAGALELYLIIVLPNGALVASAALTWTA